jgi:hypothetical protein
VSFPRSPGPGVAVACCGLSGHSNSYNVSHPLNLSCPPAPLPMTTPHRVMCEGTVDSLQNGLAASISGQYLKMAPLRWTRCAVLVLFVCWAAVERAQRAEGRWQGVNDSLVASSVLCSHCGHTDCVWPAVLLSLAGCRLFVVVINVPLIIIATRGFEVSIHVCNTRARVCWFALV